MGLLLFKSYSEGARCGDVLSALLNKIFPSFLPNFKTGVVTSFIRNERPLVIIVIITPAVLTVSLRVVSNSETTMAQNQTGELSGNVFMSAIRNIDINNS